MFAALCVLWRVYGNNDAASADAGESEGDAGGEEVTLWDDDVSDDSELVSGEMSRYWFWGVYATAS